MESGTNINKISEKYTRSVLLTTEGLAMLWLAKNTLISRTTESGPDTQSRLQ
jgi:hypothetical protein